MNYYSKKYGRLKVLFVGGIPVGFEGDPQIKVNRKKLQGALYNSLDFSPKCGLEDCSSCEQLAKEHVAAGLDYLRLCGAIETEAKAAKRAPQGLPPSLAPGMVWKRLDYPNRGSIWLLKNRRDEHIPNVQDDIFISFDPKTLPPLKLRIDGRTVNVASLEFAAELVLEWVEKNFAMFGDLLGRRTDVPMEKERSDS